MQAIMAINNSPSPVSSDSFPDHDNLQQFNDDTLLEETPEESIPELGGKRKSRRPPSTAERRANHNAVERARRESLNGRFMDLAGALPNMASVKRPSKSVIVAKSLEFVQGAQAREQYLMSQNDALRQEINDLRARLGMPPLSNSPVGVPQAIPMANTAARQRKASSVSSSNGTDSPHMSTPSSLGSFEASPTTASFTFNSAYANAFPAPSNAPPATNVGPLLPPHKDQTTPTPVTMASYTRPAPALDVNYLIALSMQQQQQQQNLMQMGNQMHQQQQLQFAPWLMPHHAAPVAAGGDSHWFIN